MMCVSAYVRLDVRLRLAWGVRLIRKAIAATHVQLPILSIVEPLLPSWDKNLATENIYVP